jgi:hypothetical protein
LVDYKLPSNYIKMKQLSFPASLFVIFIKHIIDCQS